MSNALTLAPMMGREQSLKLVHPVNLPDPETATVAVLGLGYVGLPLMVGFAGSAKTFGFDIYKERVDALRSGFDSTEMATSEELLHENMHYTCDPSDLAKADVMVVCVPTPVMQGNKPDYRPVLAATRTIAENMKRGCVVVFDSRKRHGADFSRGRCRPGRLRHPNHCSRS